jgi:hypothetical protein
LLVTRYQKKSKDCSKALKISPEKIEIVYW